EPVASLDPATAAHVLTLIHDVCKADGIAAVVSLHQVSLAGRFADRIVGLANGTVVFEGAPGALDASAAAANSRAPPPLPPRAAAVLAAPDHATPHNASPDAAYVTV